jgi:hypothetical protein
MNYIEAIQAIQQGHTVRKIGYTTRNEGIICPIESCILFRAYRGAVFSSNDNERWYESQILICPTSIYELTDYKHDMQEWPIKWPKRTKMVDIQSVYYYLEECAFRDGVPSVATWIRDNLRSEYDVKLESDPELDHLN